MEEFKFSLLNKDSEKNIPLTVFLIFVIISLIFAISFNLVFNFITIDGPSMENTFVNNDVVLLNRIAEPKRGDVIVIDGKKLDYNEDGNISYSLIIKRLIAVEGDTIYFENGNVYLKKAGETEFTKLKEEYTKDKNSTFYPLVYGQNNSTKSREFVINKDEYYFLGDNRMDSHDSRSDDFYTCKRSDILGTVSENSIKNKQKTKNFVNFTNSVYAFFGIK